MADEVVLRFDEVTFEYVHKKPTLDEASFSVRNGSKLTLMGQNGAGKSTLFGLIMGDLKPKEGKISIQNGATVATAKQTVSREDLTLTVKEYFCQGFEVVPGNIDSQIAKAMDAVNFKIPVDRKVGELSGGQQARLLLAFALVQNPDILLLDEPTNNLDKEGIDHLITFLIMYDKTVIVISHDADFLNCFTEGVLYLDVFTHKIENYVGDYYSVMEEIGKRIEREQMKNAQLEKQIKDRKEKVNFFANKGGKMRKLAAKLKEETQDLEENMVDVRKEDRTIRNFKIPVQDVVGELVTINKVKTIRDHEPVWKEVNKAMRKRDRLLISGPNGVGKSTFLRSLISPDHEGATIMPDIRVGYYSQDFATLNFGHTVMESLREAAAPGIDDQEMMNMAGGFMVAGSLLGQQVGALSEGQKGLLSFARLVLMQPAILILDEPTNHINFRHIPVIAQAIDDFEGAIIMVSHMPEFVREIKFNDNLDLGKI
jgi:ATPase subunit of ABC transporter with duplicated ATPase domains